MSLLPSLLKSPQVIADGNVPTVKFVVVPKVPVGLHKAIEIFPPFELHVAKSGFPSLLK